MILVAVTKIKKQQDNNIATYNNYNMETAASGATTTSKHFKKNLHISHRSTIEQRRNISGTIPVTVTNNKINNINKATNIRKKSNNGLQTYCDQLGTKSKSLKSMRKNSAKKTKTVLNPAATAGLGDELEPVEFGGRIAVSSGVDGEIKTIKLNVEANSSETTEMSVTKELLNVSRCVTTNNNTNSDKKTLEKNYAISISDSTQEGKDCKTSEKVNTNNRYNIDFVSSPRDEIYASGSPLKPTTTTSNNWNNSKYLHKKFKRLASTNETEEVTQELQERSSTATSLISSSPNTSICSNNSIGAIAVDIKEPQQEVLKKNHNYLINSANNKINKISENLTKSNVSCTSSENLVVNVLRTAYNTNDHNVPQNSQTVLAANTNKTLSQEQSVVKTGQSTGGNSLTAPLVIGRHVCPYCNLNCNKPSVLQKHIRAHTNERPYPCDLCDIAFKTKSNYYKHCRSRSHCARQEGVEVPADAEESYSDLDIEAELSNGSSDVISRTESPLDEKNASSPTAGISVQQSPHKIFRASPASSLLYKNSYVANQQHVPLGSPAAGTLPPTTASITNSSQNSITTTCTSGNQQANDFKPYKPKFHKAALYVFPKEGVPAKEQHLTQYQDEQYQRQAQQRNYQSQIETQPLSVDIGCGLPITTPQSIPTCHVPMYAPPHHCSLSPGPQSNLNNSINEPQLQIQLQHILPSTAVPNALSIPSVSTGVGYKGHGLSSSNSAVEASGLLHPTAHFHQPLYNSVSAAVAHQQAMTTFQLISPQQLHHLQLLPHQEQLQPQAQNSTLATVSLACPTVLKTNYTQSLQRNSNHDANFVISSHLSQPMILEQCSNNMKTVTNASFVQKTNKHENINPACAVSVAASNGVVQLNKEFLQERISKIISQNEAIVENKEHLLQKKYPKLNRSRSLQLNNNNNNINECNSITGSVMTSKYFGVNEKDNLKINQAIASKKQKQPQQYIQQQQQHYQPLLSVQQQKNHLFPQCAPMAQQLQSPFHEDTYNQIKVVPQPLTAKTQNPPINGLSKNCTMASTEQCFQSNFQYAQIPQNTHLPMAKQQIDRTAIPHITAPKTYVQQEHHQQEKIAYGAIPSSLNNNMPLNLSSKSKNMGDNSHTVTSSTTSTLNMPIAITSTSSKRSMEQTQMSNVGEISYFPCSTASGSKPHGPPNNSIIKNLLLNARGLAVPTGEGDDAVYKCPLCTMEFRTAEDLQLHNSTYCQGVSSSASSPISSPSYKFFRSNSLSLNLPDLKSSLFLKNNPLSLAKLAWSQLKTKPSSLVLSRLSAAQGSSNIAKDVTTTTSSGVIVANTTLLTTSQGANRVITEGPLPSPGPLLGKTPLVGGYNKSNDLETKSTEVVITKIHDENPAIRKERTPIRYVKDEGCNGEPFQLSTAPIEILPNVINGSQNTSIGQNNEEKKEVPKRFTSSGGYMIPISECSEFDQSTKMIRTPLLSGGSFQEVSPKSKDKSENNSNATVVSSMKIGVGALSGSPQHFQFPPITSMTAFNSLTLKLPPLQIIPSPIGGEKIVPYVPGIPGPGTLTPQLLPPPQNLKQQKSNLEYSIPRNLSPTGITANNPFIVMAERRRPDLLSISFSHSGSTLNAATECSSSESSRYVKRSSNKSMEAVAKKSFSFANMVDKTSTGCHQKGFTTQKEIRHFNFDVISKEPDLIIQPNTTCVFTSMKFVNTISSSTSATDITPITESGNKTQFLRPTSLPLKPGTFVPKKHHGITPTANTLPLISPETPRPSKACVQLYLNGHAYTYLGLKCSTKMYYCTVNLPQPSYVAEMHKLSMYSVWQVCAENNPHPLGFKPKTVIALYDSRQKSVVDTLAGSRKLTYNMTGSQPLIMTPFVNTTGKYYHHQIKHIPGPINISSSELTESAKFENDHTDNPASNNSKKEQLLVGGYESHEDYTYIRGRGRGRYVCSECGIRCKKPSMLKKHIRTHTDVRPYTCTHCNFSFKTKGNLTKHMQSKSHYKKCVELGLNPGPMPPDSEFGDPELELDQQSTTSAGGGTSSLLGESDSEDFSDNGSESSDAEIFKSRLQQHEAAHCLLSLSMTPPIRKSASPQLKNGTVVYQQEIKSSTAATSEPLSAAQEVINFKSYSSPSSSHLAGIKRVVSFTSPKPPFDYQKQEQYYSNPEASKPKRSAYSASTTDSGPIDLTKPRPAEVFISSPKMGTPTISTTMKTNSVELSSMPGRIQTQAQIQEFIFGKSNNESGFLKTLYSVSDKVRVTSDQAEYTKKINESGLLQTYLTEQALHYTKIKQSQMSPSFQDAPSKLDNGVTSTINEKLLTVWSDNTKTKTTMIGTKLLDEKPEKPLVKNNNDTPKPSIEITEEKEKECHKPASWKSSDEGEDSESSPSDHEIMLHNKTNAILFTSRHNANLPSAVHQPGTTDFSGVLTSSAAPTRTVIVGEDGFRKSKNHDIQSVYARVPMASDGRSVCTICSKSFQKQHQLVLHMNIHYMERKFKCESCAVSFRTQGHLQKHERSEAHKNKVMMTSTFGVATTSNPRPFECIDCKIAFRIHGHLAKHLRSKTHVQKLECLQKLPFGTYAEIERAGVSLTEIDTTDCDNALISLKLLAQKLMENDSSKLKSYTGLGHKNGTTDSQCGIGSQDSTSEDGFSAATSAAANAIASLENDSAATTPQRGNSTSEDEAGVTNSLKRRLPSSLTNGEEYSHTLFNVSEAEKRIKTSDSKPNASPTSQSN